MPSLSEIPDGISREKFIRALRRLGFTINMTGGKGSHCKVECPKSGKIIVIKGKMRKDTFRYVVGNIEKYSNVTWKQIKDEL